MPAYDSENQPRKTVTLGLIYSIVTEAITVFVELQEDVTFAPQYSAKLWFISVTFWEFDIYSDIFWRFHIRTLLLVDRWFFE
jgi:hypothetical protein